MEPVKPYLILCLGNELLSDDAFGSVIATKLQNESFDISIVDVIYAPLAGFKLIDFFNDRKSVLILDSIITGKSPPGTIHFFEANHLIPSNSLINSHQISLPTAIELGRKLGYNMPKNIDILAVEVQDITTFSTELSIEVQSSLNMTISKVHNWIELKTNEKKVLLNS